MSEWLLFTGNFSAFDVYKMRVQHILDMSCFSSFINIKRTEGLLYVVADDTTRILAKALLFCFTTAQTKWLENIYWMKTPTLTLPYEIITKVINEDHWRSHRKVQESETLVITTYMYIQNPLWINKIITTANSHYLRVCECDCIWLQCTFRNESNSFKTKCSDQCKWGSEAMRPNELDYEAQRTNITLVNRFPLRLQGEPKRLQKGW